MVIEEVLGTNKFKKAFKNLDSSIKQKVNKQIKKILENPKVGKLLRYNLKNERAVYVKPYRIIYTFKGSTLYLLKLKHRKSAYK